MTDVFLKPAETADGVALVRDPVTMIPLGANGEWKTMSSFWQRRIRDNEVISTLPQAEIAAKPAKSMRAPAPAAEPSE